MINDTHCCGCGVCAVSCPAKAITIKRNIDGFFRPDVDLRKCIRCDLCSRVCTCQDSSVAGFEDPLESPKGYSAIHKDPEILRTATSGGAGWAIAQFLMNRGWHAVGVRFDTDRGIACHFKAESLAQYRESMNSKYLPSYTPEAFSQLWDGKRYVVFGTPCQIDSLRRLIRLKKREENFILVDLFCHGVPSYLLWQNYLEKNLQSGETLRDVRFRDKSNGWHSYTLTLKSDWREIRHQQKNHDLFYNLFLANIFLDKPCYSCKFRTCSSSADIRIGDLWGDKYSANRLGVSGILAFSAGGQEIIDGLSDFCEMRQEETSIVIAGQIKGNYQVAKCRSALFESLRQKKSLRGIYFRHGWRLLLRNLIPYAVKVHLKRLLK